MRGKGVGFLALTTVFWALVWVCLAYTMTQIIDGQLSGRSLLGWLIGGLVYGLCLFVRDLWALKRKSRLQEL